MVEGGESSVGIGKEVRFSIFFSFGRFFNSSKYFLIFLRVEEFILSIVCPANFASGNSSKEEKSREANWMSSKGIAFALYCLLESWNRHINWYIFDINWYQLVYLWSPVQDSYTLPTAEKQIKAAGASDTAMANSKNVMAQVILAWDTIIQGRSKHHPRLQHLPHPHPYIHRPLPLPHPHHHLAQHAVNLRFYSLNLGTEVRIS